jgi:putative FmdB family regulatory protein
MRVVPAPARQVQKEIRMPTYQYRCTECGNELEAVQKFTDPALTECPSCTGQLRKVFNAVGVVFKGSGFYRTDSRADKKSGSGSSPKSESGAEKSTEKKTADTSASSGSTSATTSDSSSKQPATAGSGSGSGKSSSGSGSSTAA